MKKLITLIITLAFLASLCACSSVIGEKPYKSLKSDDVVSASVQLSPPNITLQIEDIDNLVNLLNDVVIYNKDNSYSEYCGQGVIFSLTMSDGTQTNIMAYAPFLVIDGVGYKTKYEPCEVLNSYANSLLSSDDSP